MKRFFKTLKIKVTDGTVALTSGIIQGLSGESYFPQNGKLVGSSGTHVLIDNPKMGYGYICRKYDKNKKQNLAMTDIAKIRTVR